MTHVTAQKLDGTATAAAIKEELRVRVAALKERGIVPGLLQRGHPDPQLVLDGSGGRGPVELLCGHGRILPEWPSGRSDGCR